MTIKLQKAMILLNKQAQCVSKSGAAMLCVLSLLGRYRLLQAENECACSINPFTVYVTGQFAVRMSGSES